MRKIIAMVLIASSLSGCALGQEYNAGDLGRCWTSLFNSFCVVRADREHEAVSTGTSVAGMLSGPIQGAASGAAVAFIPK